MARLGRALKEIALLVFAVLLVGLLAVVGWLAARGPLAEFLTGQRYLGEFFTLTVMLSVYVLSFLAYRTSRSRARLRQISDDLHKLGGVDPETTNTAYRQAQSVSLYLVTVTLATAFTAIGGALLFSTSTDLINASTNTLQAMRYGFLGGYVFSLQIIYRRYTTDDLQPAVYLYCAFAIAMGLIFNFVAFEALQGIAGSQAAQPPAQPAAANIGLLAQEAQQLAQPVTGIGAGLLAIVAFSLGYFPSLAISWFNQISYRALGVAQNRMDALPLSLIDGISPFHEVRLRDNGVDNVQNLAAVDIVTLLVNSSFSVQQVIDWVDQAVLYLYVDTDTANSFRRAGIRSASDFKDRWEGVLEKGDDALTTRFADQLQSTRDRLDTLKQSLVKGPNLHYVEPYWRMAKIDSEERFQTLYGSLQEQAVAHRTDQKALSELKQKQEDLRKRMISAGIRPPEPDTAEKLVGQGVLCEQDGKKDEAAVAYRAAMARDPKYAAAYNSLAWLYITNEETFGKEYADPLKWAEEAVKLQKAQDQTVENYAAYLDTLATIQIKLNLLDDAARSLQEASKVQNISEAGRQYIEQHLKAVQELKAQKAVPINTEAADNPPPGNGTDLGADQTKDVEQKSS